MIEFMLDSLLIECNGCGDSQEESGTVTEIIVKMSDSGWLITEGDSGDFKHYCRQCAAKDY